MKNLNKKLLFIASLALTTLVGCNTEGDVVQNGYKVIKSNLVYTQAMCSRAIKSSNPENVSYINSLFASDDDFKQNFLRVCNEKKPVNGVIVASDFIRGNVKLNINDRDTVKVLLKDFGSYQIPNNPDKFFTADYVLIDYDSTGYVRNSRIMGSIGGSSVEIFLSLKSGWSYSNFFALKQYNSNITVSNFSPSNVFLEIFYQDVLNFGRTSDYWSLLTSYCTELQGEKSVPFMENDPINGTDGVGNIIGETTSTFDNMTYQLQNLEVISISNIRQVVSGSKFGLISKVMVDINRTNNETYNDVTFKCSNN